MAAVLLLMNTYPLLVSEDLVFRTKAASLQNSVSVMVYSLSGLDQLDEENVAQAMAALEETGLSRILVTDSAGKVLYDTRETNDAVGEYSFYTEIVQALLGVDTSSSSYRDGAFRSRAASPVLYQNQIIGAVYAYEYDTEQAALLEGLQSNLLRLSAGIAVATLCISGLLSLALTRKIARLLTAIRKVREGAYSHRAEVRGRDEIAQLAQEFNSLTDRLQTTENARRRFVSDASHELKTPLAAIRLLTDSILQTENIDPVTAREFVADIGAEAERLSRITEDLLRLTRLDSGVMETPTVVDVLPVLEQVLRMMGLVAQEKGTELTYRAEGTCTVLASRDEIHQVIYNLTDNAVKYAPPGSTVQVSLLPAGGPGGADSGGQRPRDPGGGSAPDLRAVLPGGQGPLPGRRRHGPGTGHRQRHGGQAGRHGGGGQPARRRRGVHRPLALAGRRRGMRKRLIAVAVCAVASGWRWGWDGPMCRSGGGPMTSISGRRIWRRSPAPMPCGRKDCTIGDEGDLSARQLAEQLVTALLAGPTGPDPHRCGPGGDGALVPGAQRRRGHGGPVQPVPAPLRRGAVPGGLRHHADPDPAAGDLRGEHHRPGPAAGLPGPAELHRRGRAVLHQRGRDRAPWRPRCTCWMRTGGWRPGR